MCRIARNRPIPVVLPAVLLGGALVNRTARVGSVVLRSLAAYRPEAGRLQCYLPFGYTRKKRKQSCARSEGSDLSDIEIVDRLLLGKSTKGTSA